MQDNIITIVVPMIITAVINFIIIGYNKTQEDKIKKQIEESVGTKLDKFLDEFERFKENSFQNDLAILWGLLNDKAEDIIRSKRCDLDTFYYFENLFLRYDSMGGNHGMNLTYQKIKSICEKTIDKQEDK